MSRSMFGVAPRTGRAGRDWANTLSPLGDRTLKVVWDVSNKCNLRCKMCHFAFDDVFYRPATYTTPEQFETLAQTVLPHAHTLILSAGNEPLTSPHFIDIIRIVARHAVPHVLFITNGTRLTKTIAEAVIEAGINQVQVSIDGATKETYEDIRKGSNFEKLIGNLKYLDQLKREAGSSIPQVQFNIVLMRSNLEELPEFIDLAESVGAEWIAARHLLIMDGLGVEDESLLLCPDDANHHFRRFLDRAERSKVQVISFPDFFDTDQLESTRPVRIEETDKPFGFVDVPSAIHCPPDGTLKMEGWALDAVRLTGVTIERSPLPQDVPTMLNERGRVHLGDALLNVERPDVALLYPDFRQAAFAGWSADVFLDDNAVEAGLAVELHVVAHSLSGAINRIGLRSVETVGAVQERVPA